LVHIYFYTRVLKEPIYVPKSVILHAIVIRRVRLFYVFDKENPTSYLWKEMDVILMHLYVLSIVLLPEAVQQRQTKLWRRQVNRYINEYPFSA
jgi:hypothetical protein